MSADYELKTIPTIRLVAIEATLAFDEIGQHIRPMFDEVAAALDHAEGALEVPIATYSATASGMEVIVGFAHPGPAPAGTRLVDLPEITAVCGVLHGPLSGLQPAWEAMHNWIVAKNYTFAGPCREVYVRAQSEDQSDWITELQQPVVQNQG